MNMFFLERLRLVCCKNTVELCARPRTFRTLYLSLGGVSQPL